MKAILFLLIYLFTVSFIDSHPEHITNSPKQFKCPFEEGYIEIPKTKEGEQKKQPGFFFAKQSKAEEIFRAINTCFIKKYIASPDGMNTLVATSFDDRKQAIIYVGKISATAIEGSIVKQGESMGSVKSDSTIVRLHIDILQNAGNFSRADSLVMFDCE